MNIRINPVVVLFIIGSLHLFSMWPGILSPDSQGQYAMAIAGVYSDHHPPLMSFVWRYLDKIVSGPGMMFLLHLGLLYAAIFYLIISVNNFIYKFLLLLFSLIPQIFFYSNMIWKDVGFTFSFLFIAAYLGYITVNKKQLNWQKDFLKIIILLIILFYGTAVKFQAQFCAPVLLAWLAYILADYKYCNKLFIKYFSILSILFYICLNSVNTILVPNINKNHSWQLVKLYDLAAISISTNQDLFPLFTKNNNFTMQELKNRLSRKSLDKFSYYMVDDLIFENAILKSGSNEAERKQLYFCWLKTIIKHPVLYIKHRMINMASMLLYHPSFKYINKYNNNKIIIELANIIIYLTMCNLVPAILSLIYFILGIIAVRKNILTGLPLLCFNLISLIMLAVLFFCSMAGTPRYTYIVVCMVHASHIFAYLTYNNLKQGLKK